MIHKYTIESYLVHSKMESRRHAKVLLVPQLFVTYIVDLDPM